MDNHARNIIVFMGLAVLDQLVKAWIQAANPVLNFSLFFIHEVRNTGASFGILQGSNVLLIFVSFIALGLILLNANSITRKYQIPTCLMVAGIIGNLIDRIFRGYVVDYFDLGWWPAFNIADACIFVGVFWTAVMLIADDINQGKKKPKRKN
jgi:signal peptidase II